MRVLLTGGSGSVGKAVVDRLVSKGYSVLVIGRRVGMEFDGAEYRSCDINDYPRLREVIRGCELVVHLAAIPNPAVGTPEQLFDVICTGTFNVFQAAAEEGIRRIIQASSINATGQYFGVKPAPLHYLPLDEAHPVFGTDAYSFSKHVIEEIGEFFWHREGISSLAYRLPFVAPVSYRENMPASRERIQRVVGGLLEQSPEERLAWFERSWKAFNQFRAGKPYEIPGMARQRMSEMPEDLRSGVSIMGSRVNFFTMLDERDSAQAIDKGLSADFEGAHTLFVNDSHNWTGVDSKTLVDLFYPDVKVIKKDLVGTETVISIDKARQMIGFEPEFSFA